MKKIVIEMIQFGAKGFRAGRELEGALEEGLEQLANRPPPQPDPLKQLEVQKVQQDMQLDAAKFQAERQDAQFEKEKTAQELQLEREQAELDANLEVMRTVAR